MENICKEKFNCGLNRDQIDLIFKNFMEQCNYSIYECLYHFNVVHFVKRDTDSNIHIIVDMEHLIVKKFYDYFQGRDYVPSSFDFNEFRLLFKAIDQIKFMLRK